MPVAISFKTEGLSLSVLQQAEIQQVAITPSHYSPLWPWKAFAVPRKTLKELVHLALSKKMQAFKNKI